ncbi:MAG: ATP-binding protein, partial [Elusimicrobiota bacterium]
VSKDYVDNIIKSMIDTLIVTDAKGKIKTVNQATLNLLGYEEEEIIGKPAGILFAEELLFKGTKWEKLLKEGSARDYQITYKTKTGEKIPVSFSGSIMRDKEGELIGIVGIAHDMRQIIALQEKEITAKAEAEKAAISRVSGVLAHEMNTPLMGILGLARILEKNIDLKESDLKENTVTIQQLTYKCSEIVKKIATLAKPVELKFDKISKNEFIDIVENALSVLRGSFQANQIEVIKSYTADEFTVKIDRNEMSSVFSNILTNSIKAMPDGGGKLTISISCHTERSEVSQKQDSSASPQNDFVEVVFKDTGKGIEKENLKKIFELYFSELKADIGGIGLGLSESQKIVKQHGGEIFVESDGLDKGATFKVVLPVLSATGGRINSCLQK